MSERNPYEPSRAWTPPNSAHNPKKPTRGPLVLLAVLTLLASVSFNLAMMIMVLALVFGAPLVVIWIIVTLFQKDENGLVQSVLYLGVLLAMLPVGYCTLRIQHYFLDMRLEPLIAAIEAHHKANGRYPATLDDLELSPPSCSAVGGLGMRPMYTQSEGSYSLTCMTFGFNHRTYRPAQRRWENWD